MKFDLNPQRADIVKADYKNLPSSDGEFGSLVWDPPFVCGTHVKSEMYVMGAKFSMYRNIADLQKDYSGAIKEFSRVLKNKGWLIVKCQDTVHGRKNYFNHILVHDLAVENGFRPIDLFILLSRNRFSAVERQNHCRKFHSYFWVFKKMERKKAA